MTVKYGEMTNLVTPTISIDQYKPKIGEANETVVVAFEVAFEQPAKDLSNLIETDITESLDVDPPRFQKGFLANKGGFINDNSACARV